LIESFLTNVPLGTANLLSYAMIVVVAIFLISSSAIVYYYWRKMKRMKAASPTGSA
jgi:uncharacterized membrane protein YedE/YeeE